MVTVIYSAVFFDHPILGSKVGWAICDDHAHVLFCGN